MISKRTLELIQELQRCPHWLKNLGEHPGYDTFVQVESLKVAITMFNSIEWETTCHEAKCGLSTRLHHDFENRYEHWNAYVDAIDDLIIPFLDPVVVRFLSEHTEVQELQQELKLIREPHEPKPQPHECLIFRQRLLSTIRMACMEAEYSDVVPLAFFSEMSAWYLAGHLPCGLTEEYPEGKLMVY